MILKEEQGKPPPCEGSLKKTPSGPVVYGAVGRDMGRRVELQILPKAPLVFPCPVGERFFRSWIMRLVLASGQIGLIRLDIGLTTESKS